MKARFHHMTLLLGLGVLVWAPPSQGQERGTKVGLAVHGCSGRFDVEAIAAALRLELSSVFGAEPDIGGDSEASWRIQIACSDADTVELEIVRTKPEAAETERLSLADVDHSTQPRTIALTVAERVRTIGRRQPSLPPIPVIAPIRALELALPPTAGRTRLLGGLAASLGALTLASVVIGGSLLGLGERDPASPISGLVSSGSALLAIGGAALIGTSISLAFWVRARKPLK